MTDTPTHIIPHNIEAEEAIIGAMLMSTTAIEAADSVGLRGSDFYRPQHREIYSAIAYLNERGTVDELAVVNELRARRELTKAGGAAYIMGLAEKCPAVANAKAYADEVVDQSKLRCLVNTGDEIARLGYEHPDKIKNLYTRAAIIMESAQKSAMRDAGPIGDAASLSEWVVRHITGETEERERWAYPLPRIQNATGGFGKGQLISAGGLPGSGKSAFKNQIILGLDPTVRVGIINLEMDREDEQVRFISTLTGIPGRKIWNRSQLTDAEKLLVAEAAESLSERCYEIHQGSKSIEQIRAIQKRHKYDLLVVDHFHKILGVEDYKNLARFASTLKDIALDDDCAVLNLFQLNKGDGPPGTTPTPDRVKGGGSIEENSDHMMFIHRTVNQAGYATNNAQIIMAKQRGGSSGWAVKVTFNGDRVSFEEPAKEEAA